MLWLRPGQPSVNFAPDYLYIFETNINIFPRYHLQIPIRVVVNGCRYHNLMYAKRKVWETCEAIPIGITVWVYDILARERALYIGMCEAFVARA